MIKIIKTTTNNNQNSNNNNNNNNNKISTIDPKIFVLKTYQSYENTDAQRISNKTARHFLQYQVQMVP